MAEKSRRSFIKITGAAAGGLVVGGVVSYVATVPGIASQVDTLTKERTSLQTQVERLTSAPPNFRFHSQSKAATVEGVDHRMIMNGNGKVNPTRKEVIGAGTFLHFNAASPVPRTVIAAGTWRAKRLIGDYTQIGTWGVFAAGWFEMEVELVRTIPSPAVIPATLLFTCNIGAAGLRNLNPRPPPENLLEGFYLSIPGTPFVTGGAAGPFEPLTPEGSQGLTILTTAVEAID